MIAAAFRFGRGLPLLLLLASFSLFCPLSGKAEQRALSLDSLTREGYGYVPIVRPRPELLAVKATLNGQPATLLLDTGFEAIFLRRHWVAQAGIATEKLPAATLRGTAGSEEGALEKGTLETLRLGNVEIRSVPVFISRLGAFSDTPKSRLRGDGFLGVQFLAACGAIIDLQNLRLYLKAPGQERVADLGPRLRALGMTEIPLARAGLKYLAPTTLNGVSSQLVVDTGALRTLLDARAAGRLGVVSAQRTSARLTDLSGRRFEGQLANLQSFEVGPFAVPGTRVALLENGLHAGPAAGLLGLSVLGTHGGVIDCGSNKLYLIARDGGLALRENFDVRDPAASNLAMTPTPFVMRVPQRLTSRIPPNVGARPGVRR